MLFWVNSSLVRFLVFSSDSYISASFHRWDQASNCPIYSPKCSRSGSIYPCSFLDLAAIVCPLLCFRDELPIVWRVIWKRLRRICLPIVVWLYLWYEPFCCVFHPSTDFLIKIWRSTKISFTAVAEIMVLKFKEKNRKIQEENGEVLDLYNPRKNTPLKFQTRQLPIGLLHCKCATYNKEN